MELLLDRDARDANPRQRVPMTLTLAKIIPAFVLEDPKLGAAQVLDHLGRALGALHERLAHGDLVAVAHHEHLIERQLVPRLAGKARDLEHRLGCQASLHTVDAGDRVHAGFLLGALAFAPWISSDLPSAVER